MKVGLVHGARAGLVRAGGHGQELVVLEAFAEIVEGPLEGD